MRHTHQERAFVDGSTVMKANQAANQKLTGEEFFLDYEIAEKLKPSKDKLRFDNDYKVWGPQ